MEISAERVAEALSQIERRLRSVETAPELALPIQVPSSAPLLFAIDGGLDVLSTLGALTPEQLKALRARLSTLGLLTKHVSRGGDFIAENDQEGF